MNNDNAPITAPRILPMPPRTTKDIKIPIHSQCFAGKNENKKLTCDPAAPANPHPIAKETKQTNFTFTPTNSALVRFCDVARIATPISLNFKKKAKNINMKALNAPE